MPAGLDSNFQIGSAIQITLVYAGQGTEFNILLEIFSCSASLSVRTIAECLKKTVTAGIMSPFKAIAFSITVS
jgi:hypothetical protein